MYNYLKILEEIPEDLRKPLAKFGDIIESHLLSQLAVTREDFSSLRRTVEELAQAQKKTEERIGGLERAVEELAQAQKKTDESVKELARAQLRFERTFNSKIGALGARWGLGSETAFRKGMRGILSDIGMKTERYLKFDEAGKVFGRPDQVEIDIVMKDSEVYLVEIKSSLDKAGVSLFERKARFYEEESGRKVAKKIIISSFVEGKRPAEMAESFGMEVYTDMNEIEEAWEGYL